jgi:hypothetical protein
MWIREPVRASAPISQNPDTNIDNPLNGPWRSRLIWGPGIYWPLYINTWHVHVVCIVLLDCVITHSNITNRRKFIYWFKPCLIQSPNTVIGKQVITPRWEGTCTLSRHQNIAVLLVYTVLQQLLILSEITRSLLEVTRNVSHVWAVRRQLHPTLKDICYMYL